MRGPYGWAAEPPPLPTCVVRLSSLGAPLPRPAERISRRPRVGDRTRTRACRLPTGFSIQDHPIHPRSSRAKQAP